MSNYFNFCCFFNFFFKKKKRIIEKKFYEKDSKDDFHFWKFITNLESDIEKQKDEITISENTISKKTISEIFQAFQDSFNTLQTDNTHKILTELVKDQNCFVFSFCRSKSSFLGSRNIEIKNSKNLAAQFLVTKNELQKYVFVQQEVFSMSNLVDSGILEYHGGNYFISDFAFYCLFDPIKKDLLRDYLTYWKIPFLFDFFVQKSNFHFKQSFFFFLEHIIGHFNHLNLLEKNIKNLRESELYRLDKGKRKIKYMNFGLEKNQNFWVEEEGLYMKIKKQRIFEYIDQLYNRTFNLSKEKAKIWRENINKMRNTFALLAPNCVSKDLKHYEEKIKNFESEINLIIYKTIPKIEIELSSPNSTSINKRIENTLERFEDEHQTAVSNMVQVILKNNKINKKIRIKIYGKEVENENKTYKLSDYFFSLLPNNKNTPLDKILINLIIEQFSLEPKDRKIIIVEGKLQNLFFFNINSFSFL